MAHDTTPRPIDVTLTSKQITRFWALVKRSEDGCWEWQGSITDAGYGVVFFSPKTYRAHRIAWLLTNGQIPDGMLVCHHCDNPRCVRPDHLFAGTSKENHDDMKHKGRAPVGDRNGRRTRPDQHRTILKGHDHPNAKLNDDIVRSIRRRFVRTGPYRTNATALAREYGVTSTTITLIAERKSWRHVEDS